METNQKIQIAFLVLLGLAIFSILTAVFILYKNLDDLRAEPIEYGMNKYDLSTCSCSSPEGPRFFTREDNSYTYQPEVENGSTGNNNLS